MVDYSGLGVYQDAEKSKTQAGMQSSLLQPRGATTSQRQQKKSTVTATRARQTSSTIRKEVQRELSRVLETKVSHQNSGPQDCTYSGQIHNCIGSLVKGDGPFQCSGNLIKPKSITVRGKLSSNQTYNCCRVILFRWKDAAIPSPSGLLDATSTVFAPFSSQYWVNVHKMEILEERYITLKLRNNVGEDAQHFVLHHNFSLDSPSIQLPDTSGPGLYAQMNGLYVLTISDDAITTFPQLVMRSELRFTDA